MRLTSTDEEPPIGTTVHDAKGRTWVRVAVERGWQMHDDDGSPINDDPESWIRVAGNYGPVTA